MRIVITILVLASLAAGQEGAKSLSVKESASHEGAHALTIPAGTKLPVSLRNTISTKSNHPGDPVYAQTTFPVVVDEHIVVPAGTYVQGKISAIKPAGRIKGRAEVLMHFTTLIYPSGYTVMLPGSIENAPAVDKSRVKDKEGTIQADRNAGKTAETIARPAATGAIIGAVSHGGEGALIGAGAGGAVGTAIAALSHGNEVKIGPGTTLEVVLQRDVPVDSARIKARAD
jgi:hypothetical protein